MGENSKIEWCDHTFNPWIGCSHVSEGCRNCYAETMMDKRLHKAEWGPGKPRARTSESNWMKPVAWNKKAAKDGTRPRVFCASLSDWLDPEVPMEWLADLLDLIAATPHLDWLLLTKRPELWQTRLQEAWYVLDDRHSVTAHWVTMWIGGKCPPPNVWIGAAVENQAAADKRIPELLNIPAKVRFLSCEPLLGPVDIERWLVKSQHIHMGLSVSGALRNKWFSGFKDDDGYPLSKSKVKKELLRLQSDGIEMLPLGDCSTFDSSTGCPGHPEPRVDWVIAGGESGPDARPMHPEWARSLRDQCAAADVPFLFKQWGEWAPNCLHDGPVCRTVSRPKPGKSGVMFRCGKSKSDRVLDGVAHNAFPEARKL